MTTKKPPKPVTALTAAALAPKLVPLHAPEVERVRAAARLVMDDALLELDRLEAEVVAGWEVESILLNSIAIQHERERGLLARIEGLAADNAALRAGQGAGEATRRVE